MNYFVHSSPEYNRDGFTSWPDLVIIADFGVWLLLLVNLAEAWLTSCLTWESLLDLGIQVLIYWNLRFLWGLVWIIILWWSFYRYCGHLVNILLWRYIAPSGVLTLNERLLCLDKTCAGCQVFPFCNLTVSPACMDGNVFAVFFKMRLCFVLEILHFLPSISVVDGLRH